MFLMWCSAMQKKEKKACLGSNKNAKTMWCVTFEIKGKNCSEIWFHDVTSVPKNIKFVEVGMLGADSCLSQKSHFSIKICNFKQSIFNCDVTMK